MFRKSNFRLLFIALLLMAAAGAWMAPAALARTRAFDRRLGRNDFAPEPRLISPVLDKVNLAGKDTLEFKWSPHEGDPVRRDYYDFRLYRGYNMLESTLILKKRLKPGESHLMLKTSIFKSDHVYTWSLRQVYTGSIKSGKSYSTFRVTK